MNMEDIKIKKITIEIPEDKKLVLKDGAYIIIEDKPEDVRDRIKTFEDAYKELEERDDMDYLIREYDNRWTDSEELLAYLKLRIIVAALNEGWEPKLEKGEVRYFAWLAFKDGGVAYAVAGYDPSYAGTSVGSRLAFKSRELAAYAGEQFKDLWIDYLTK